MLLISAPRRWCVGQPCRRPSPIEFARGACVPAGPRAPCGAGAPWPAAPAADRRRAGGLQDAGDQRRHVHLVVSRGRAPDAREGEEVVDERGQLPGVAHDARAHLAPFIADRVAVLLEEDARVAVERAPRRAQVVGHRVAERLQLTCGCLELGGALFYARFELLVQTADLPLGALALRDVARDTEDLGDLARGIREQDARHLRGHDAAVVARLVDLGDVDPQGGVSRLHGGDQWRQALADLPEGPRGESLLEALREHLVRRVAAQTLDRRAHAGEAPVGDVEQPDDVGGVFGDQAVAGLALAQLTLGAHPAEGDSGLVDECLDGRRVLQLLPALQEVDHAAVVRAARLAGRRAARLRGIIEP